MKMHFIGVVAAGVLAAMNGPAAVLAAEAMSIGQQEYNSSCAACHGAQADGQGPMAGLMSTAVPDLTQLAKNNGGVFPLERMYSIIDGRADVAWHGSRDMPVWGSRYKEMAAEEPANELLDEQTLNLMARSRILAIVDYLYGVQQK
ncbi:MAG: cytochrome c [Notoacmeibacter sp.]|nr:cytochrome c [Notoacmeibacter sp.]